MDNVGAGEAAFQVVRKYGVYFDGNKKGGGMKLLLDGARKGAGAGAEFHHNSGFAQSQSFNHPFSQPG